MIKVKSSIITVFAICVTALIAVHCASSERNNPLDPGCTKNCETTPQFTVTFDWGYETGEAVPWPIVIDSGETLGAGFPSAHERDGYTFDGWFGANGTQYFATTPITADVALTARWTIIEDGMCVVTLYDDVIIAQEQIVCGEPVGEAVLISLEKDGFTFDGWFDDNGTQYLATTPITEDVTLTAYWTEIEEARCVVTLFDDVEIGQEEVVCGETISASALTPPVKDGFTFDGWFDDNDARYTAATPITADVTLTARWTEIEEGMCVLTLNDDGTIGQIQVVCGEPIGDALEPLEKTGYDFDGWFTTDGDDGEVITGDAVFDDDATVYARWTLKIYTITFDPKGGGVDPDTGKTGDGWKLVDPLPTPTKEGYDFDGWFTEEEGGERITVNTAFSGDDTVYARWTIVSHTVKFIIVNGVVFDSAKTDITTEYKLTAPLPTPTRTGYDFGGWFTEEEDGDSVTVNTVFDDDAEIYARWTLRIYTITFDPKGGIVAPDTGKTGDGWKLVDSLPMPTRQGYDFDGWFTEEEGGERITVNTAFSGSDTVYARWTIISYTVKFVTGTDETIDSVKTDITKEYKITAPQEPTRALDPRAEGVPEGLYKNGDNYVFEGWYFGGLLFDFDAHIIQDITLTAMWEAPVIKPDGDGNPLENAIDHVNDQTSGEYVLVLSENVSIDGAVEVKRGLTVIGRSAGANPVKITGAETFELKSSNVTFEDVNITRMAVTADSTVTLAGGAIVDTLTLRATSLRRSYITIADGWEGEVRRLDLYTIEEAIQDTWWAVKDVVRPITGGTLTSADIDRITLGYFKCNDSETSRQIGTDYKISDTGANIGTLVAKD